MEEENSFSNELMMDLLKRTLPLGVVGELHEQGFRTQDLIPRMFPEHVGAEILRSLEHPREAPRIVCNFTMDWSMSYRDARSEEAFLQWESDCLIGTRTQNWLSGVVLFITALLAYSQVFQCQNAKSNWHNWPCEGRILWASITFLMWILPMWNVVKPPFLWQYRDIICGLHQAIFGCFVATLTVQLARTPPEHSTINPNPLWYCTFPVFLESVLARVRLKYYIGTSVVLMGVVVSPWIGGVLDTVQLSWEVWCMNCFVMFVGPGCILVLYELAIRRWFESTHRNE